MDSGERFVFNGVLDGDAVEVSTMAWQSGEITLPKELYPTAQEKVLKALLAIKAGRNLNIDELNDTVKEKGNLMIVAVSPPICWNPSVTTVKRI